MTTIRKFLMSLAIASCAAGAMAAPALAAGWDHGREVRGHEWRGRDWRAHHRVYAPAPYAYAAPSYGYYGYVAPPVIYGEPQATFSLDIPLIVH